MRVFPKHIVTVNAFYAWETARIFRDWWPNAPNSNCLTGLLTSLRRIENAWRCRAVDNLSQILTGRALILNRLEPVIDRSTIIALAFLEHLQDRYSSSTELFDSQRISSTYFYFDFHVRVLVSLYIYIGNDHRLEKLYADNWRGGWF